MTSKKSSDNTGPNTGSFYGRRKGRPLNKSRAEVIETLLPQLCVPEEQLTQNADLNLHSLFPHPYQELWMEIGFGNGEQLCHMMREYPKNAYIGAEPFINGVASALLGMKDLKRDNVRIHADDAIPLVLSLPDACIDKLFVLNPDPWHKTRHHKRRMIRAENLDHFARIMKSGAQLIMATDVNDLADWMITECTQHPAFEWTATCAEDWRTRPEELILTRYAQKGAKGSDKRQTYLVFGRSSMSSRASRPA